MPNEIQKVNNEVMPGFGSKSGFELMQRQALMLSQTTLVPKQYQGQNGVGNCIIALNMANRMNADPLMVMQNLYVVHGNPGFSSKFLISCINSCGRFSALRYEFVGEENTDSWGCYAWAIEKATGEKLKGSKITIAMAKKEGWHGKAGSKWQTMPEQMLQYRAAAFFIRVYAPEISNGMSTTDELQDIRKEPVEDQTAQAEIKTIIEEDGNKIDAESGEILESAKKEDIEELKNKTELPGVFG